MKWMKKDPTKEFLKRKGCSSECVRGGIEYLVGEWERAVQTIENGSTYFYDYANDMDCRQLLFEVIPVATSDQIEKLMPRVEIADERLKAVTTPVSRSIWGDPNDPEMTVESNWWYFRKPKDVAEDWAMP